MVVASNHIGAVLDHLLSMRCNNFWNVHAAMIASLSRFQIGNKWQFDPLFLRPSTEERDMPLLLIWAVPAVIVIGGAGYWLVHLH